MQSWHQNVVVWGRNVRWVGNETAGWYVMQSLKEAAVVYLHQHRTHQHLAIIIYYIVLQSLAFCHHGPGWAVNVTQQTIDAHAHAESWCKCTLHAALLCRFASLDLDLDLPCICWKHESQLPWSVPMLLPSC